MAEEPDDSIEQYELPVSVGEKLRAAREAKGMSIAQVAAETRITQRHLTLIEEGDFGALPGRSYSIGFARNYAKAVGLDEEGVADEVRAELSMIEPRDNRAALTFEPGDPGRVPSARLAWFSAFAAAILFIGGSFFVWTSFIAPAGSLDWLTGEEEPEAVASIAPVTDTAPDPAGAVTFTALEDAIWVKFYDQEGRQLMQKQMALGETYTVPSDVTGPQLWTGRPDALQITIGGRQVPRLAETEQVVKDVPVTAAALLARADEPAAEPAPAASAAPRRVAPASSATVEAASEPAIEQAAAGTPAASPTT